MKHLSEYAMNTKHDDDDDDDDNNNNNCIFRPQPIK